MSKQTKKAKKALLPERRFPEFQNAGEWEEKTFGGTATFLNGRAYKQEELLENGKYRVLRVGNFFSNKEWFYSDLELDENKYCDYGDLLYAWSASFGPRIWQGEKVIYHYHIWKVVENEGINRDFLFILLGYETERMKAQSANGLGLLHITKGAIEGWKCYFPMLKEQQKIADCLSSIDDLITAHTQKHEALKAHKKGLMQQLFPAKGETTPKLRFPEFRDAGEWEDKSIQKLIDDKIIISHLDGNHGSLYPRAEEFAVEGVPYITANDFINGFVDFSKCKYLPIQRALQFKKGVAKDGDILFAHNATVGPVAKLKTNLDFIILSTTATYFRCDNIELLNDFLHFALCSPGFVVQYSRVMSQSTRNQVPITTQRKFSLQTPKKEEQQKIADSLSSIDDLITAQAQKIEALKTHKKGLMQRLFPAPDEGNE